MLESLEQSNIKRMSVESPEQEPDLMFDPERDIGQAQWEGITGDYEKALRDKKWLEVAMIISRVTIMGMQRKLIALSEGQIKEMVMDLYNNSRSDIRFAADIKIFEPTMVLSDKLDWQKISDELDASSSFIENYNLYLEKLVACRLVGDIKEEPDPVLLEAALSAVKTEVRQSEDWYRLADMLAKTRLLFPDKKMDILPEEWDNMRIEVGVGGGLPDASVAADLTILAAKDARIIDGRIIITMAESKKESEEKNIMPEQRSF